MLRGVSSKWVALVTMVLLLLFSLIGVLVPQESLLAPVRVEAWQAAHPRWTAVLGPWGGFRVFYAPVFMLSQVVLGINILGCTILHLRKRGGLQRLLKGPQRSRYTGFLLVHISLLLLIGGSFLSAGYKLQGRIVLTEGDQFLEQEEQYLRLHKGRLRRAAHQGFTLRLDELAHYRKGKGYQPTQQARLSVLAPEGGTQRQGVAERNRPFIHEGLSFTINKLGYSPNLVFRDRKTGRPVQDLFVALKTFNTPEGEVHRDQVRMHGFDRDLAVSLYPSQEPGVPARMTVEWDPSVEPLEIQEGKWIVLGDYVLHFAELRRWVGFAVQSDPGYPWVVVALVIGLLGLLLRYGSETLNWWRETSNDIRSN